MFQASFILSHWIEIKPFSSLETWKWLQLFNVLIEKLLQVQ